MIDCEWIELPTALRQRLDEIAAVLGLETPELVAASIEHQLLRLEAAHDANGDPLP